MIETEGRITSHSWHATSDHISTLSKKHRAWEIGLFVLTDSKGGIVHRDNSPRVVAMIDRVKALYESKATDGKAWSDAENAVRACNWNEQVKDPLKPTVQWSEYNALNTLRMMIEAARAAIAGDASAWWHHMANGCLQAASHQAVIAAAHYPKTPEPISELYKERMNEIAAYRTYQVKRSEAYDDRLEDAYRATAACFRKIVDEYETRDRTAAEAEEARVQALPFFQRVSQRMHQARQAKRSKTG